MSSSRKYVIVLGLAVVASIPILVRGQQAAPPAKPAEAVPDKPKASSASERVTTETISGFGAKTIEVPTFDCLPVRKDQASEGELYPVPLPPFSDKVFPCTRCHDRPDDYNPKRRTLTVDHQNIKLNHGPREQWCYGCHNPTDRDQLRLAGGRLVSFEKSYELCGQCHGPKFRDWRLGIHGRRTGCWNGKQEYRLCVHCHNPHDPKFPKLAPMRRPPRPSEMH